MTMKFASLLFLLYCLWFLPGNEGMLFNNLFYVQEPVVSKAFYSFKRGG